MSSIHDVTEVRGDAEATFDLVHVLLDGLPTDAYAELSGKELRAVALLQQRLEARVRAHQLAVANAIEASGEARRQGATSTGALLAGDFGGDRRAGEALVRQAKQVTQAPQAHRAMERGQLTATQAGIVAKALALLPESVSAVQREACETQLVDDAPRMDRKTFERQADRIVAGFLPEVDLDAGEDAIIAEREKAAHAKSSFWMIDQHDGTHKGGFVVPEAQADQLRTALEAMIAPQHDPTVEDAVLEARPSHSQKLGWAFSTLLELLPADRLPDTNGVGAILTINLDHEVLTGRLAAATLSTGTRISAGEARRLACTHRLLPAVFGGDPLPLDLGRARRCFSRHQRKGLELRDKGCTFPGCDRPPGWCVVHHGRESWAEGGGTDLEDGVLICPHHHRVLHADGWEIRFQDGIPVYLPPATLDPARTARKHTRFALGA